ETLSGSRQKKDTVLSHIRSINLNEQVSQDNGNYTTISILNPVIHIERTKNELSSTHGRRSSWNYRITTSFSLQAEICGFNQQFVPLEPFPFFVIRGSDPQVGMIGTKSLIDFLTPYL